MSTFFTIIVIIIAVLLFIKFTVGFSIFLPVVIVDSQEAVVIDNRLGKDRIMHEGLNYIVPGVEVVVAKVSLKEITIDPPAQTIVTRDNISIIVDVIASIKIKDILKAVMGVDDYNQSAVSLVVTSTLDVMGSMNLVDIQKNIYNISREIKEKMKEDADRWGLEVAQVRIETVNLPDSVKEAMEKEVVAEKERKAKLLHAEAEKESAIKKAEGKKIAAAYEAEALKHEIDILKETMPNMEDNKILEFLTSVTYIHSMKNLSSSDNAKVVVYPADLQKSMNGFMTMPGLDGNMEKKEKK